MWIVYVAESTAQNWNRKHKKEKKTISTVNVAWVGKSVSNTLDSYAVWCKSKSKWRQEIKWWAVKKYVNI